MISTKKTSLFGNGNVINSDSSTSCLCEIWLWTC